eukprot:a510161_211.p2 GENE.a510161_211~~a510161_211.p2  ORF type:complete len:103 (+),score=26.47 a510161_211:39-311(+)
MASGFGVRSGEGRCFEFWANFRNCMEKTTTGQECALLRDDYMECLHHKKEFSRALRVQDERKKHPESSGAHGSVASGSNIPSSEGVPWQK